MKNRILNIVLVYLVLFSYEAKAQENNKHISSIPIVLADQYNLVRKNEQLYRINPAYLTQNNFKDQTEIYSFYQKDQQNKSYNPLKGSELSCYGIGANWLSSIDSTATFLGSVAVSKGNQNQVYAQGMRLNDSYGPYSLAHTKTADFSFQNYDLSGRYAKVFNQLTMGLHLYYKGDYAYAKTDPRAKDIASWFGLILGGKYDLSYQHQIGLSMGYQIHNQHLALDVWQGNVKQQFFLLRGFGMYDHEHKDHVFSKKRVYKQNDSFISTSASLWQKNPLSVDLLFYLAKSQLKTEEETTINLHELTTMLYLPEVKINYEFSSKWQAQLQISARLNSLQGKENRYSYSKVNDDFSGIYDYVKIGEVKPYVLKENQYQIGFNTTYKYRPYLWYSLGVSYQRESFNEYYKGTLFESQLEKQIPKVEAKMLYQKSRHQFGLGVSWESQKSQKSFTQEDTSYKSMYKEMYLPDFIFRAMDKNYFMAQIDYQYAVNSKQNVGVTLSFGKLWADKSLLIKENINYKIDTNQLYVSLYYHF